MGVSVVSVSAALGVAFAGNSALLLSASDVAGQTGSDLAPWLQGGGSAAAVAGLVYVARLIVTGQLVPRPVKDVEAELGASILAAAQREDRVLKIAEDSVQALKRLEGKHDESLLLMAGTRRTLDDVAQELQYWREMRDRGTRREDLGPDHREHRL